MSALTSLLVRDRVVPVSKIEEALQSQVFSGGDIEIILLEMNLVPEDVLSAYRAALFDLLPATRDEVMGASREALRRVPPELARSLGIVPIFFEGRSLVVAAWEPLYEPRLEEVEEQLGCELSVRIVNQARLAAALARHYGFELDARLRRLSDALRRREPGIVPYVRPPAMAMRPIVPLDEEEVEVPSEGVSAETHQPARESGPTWGVSEPERAYAATVQSEPSEPAPAPSPELQRSAGESRPGEAPRGVAPGQVAEPGRERAMAEARAGAHERNDVPASASVGPPLAVSSTLADLAKLPLSLERATELLQLVKQRDDVLFVLLRYVQQFFDFVGVFSVAKDGVRARLAHGAGLARGPIEEAFIPAPSVGMFADVLRERRPLLGVFGSAPEEHAAAAILGRQTGRLGLLAPVELSGRLVLLVYAERVRPGLGLEHASVVQGIIPAVVAALLRIILEGKTQRRSDSVRPGPQGGGDPGPSANGVEPARVQIAADASEGAEAGQRVGTHVEPERSGGDLSAVDLDAFERLAREMLGPGPEPRALANPADRHVEGRTDASKSADAREHAIEGRADTSKSAEARGSAREQAVEARGSAQGDVRNSARDQSEGALVRERIPGIPRSAPPPPAHELASASAHAGSGYRYNGAAGLAQERAAGLGAVQESAVVPADHELVEERPRQRLSLVEPNEAVPSVIIDMGESIDVLIAALLEAAPGSDPPQVGELMQLGESVLPVLVQHFPGPLWFDRARSPKRRPRAREVSAVARAVVAFGERAAPYVAALLSSPDADRSYYALLIASEIIHPDLIDPVARKVLDRDDGVRALALEVLRSYSALPQYEAVVRAIADLSERPGKDPRRQRLAVEALGELRDARTLPILLARLADRDEQVAHAAHRALVVLTGQDLGFNPRKWEAWAEGWGRAHRVEWLIEALLHQEEQVRALAGEELKLLTQQYFGYHPALPRRDREVAQRKYREWWELEGRFAFSR